jgi:cytidine deaminase
VDLRSRDDRRQLDRGQARHDERGNANVSSRSRAETCATAHAPYSGIHVGAAIRSAAGAHLQRLERRERGLSARQLRGGERDRRGRARRRRALPHRGDGGVGRGSARACIAISPCGGCRQRIREFAAGGSVAVTFPAGRRDPHRERRRALPYAFELPSSRSGR